MSSIETFTIGFLSNFFSSALVERIKANLRGRSSEEKASELALELYKLLEDIRRRTYELKTEIQALLDAIAQKETFFYDERTERLQVQGDEFQNKLSRLLNVLEQINPQFEIYQPDEYNQIRAYIELRSGILFALEEFIHAEEDIFSTKGKAILKGLVVKLDENYARVEKIVESLRNFIVKEFSFKETF